MPPSLPTAAVIGVTGYGNAHFQELQRLHQARRLRLVAATIINPDDAPETCAWLRDNGAQIFADFDEMFTALHGKLDLCCIPTGISWHRPMAERALAAGANVLVEKPLAGSIEDAQAIIDAAENAQRWAAVGFQAIWAPAVTAIKDAITSGQLGEIRKITVTGCWPRTHSYYARNAWAGKIRDTKGIVNDSPANNALAHFLNLSLYFSSPHPGQCAAVLPGHMEAEKSRVNPIETYDTVIARFTTDSGTRIFYGVTHACAIQHHPVIRIRGEHGSAIWSFQGQCSLTIDGEDHELPTDTQPSDRQISFDSLAARLHGDTQATFFPATQGIRHVQVVHAIDQASETLDLTHKAVPHGDPQDPVQTLPGIEQKILQQAQEFLT